MEMHKFCSITCLYIPNINDTLYCYCIKVYSMHTNSINASFKLLSFNKFAFLYVYSLLVRTQHLNISCFLIAYKYVLVLLTFPKRPVYCSPLSPSSRSAGRVSLVPRIVMYIHELWRYSVDSILRNVLVLSFSGWGVLDIVIAGRETQYLWLVLFI